MHQLRFCIIGCGSVARIHARCLKEIDSAVLVACSGSSEGKGLKFASDFGCEYDEDYHRMLKRDDLDAVIITTPSGTHADIGAYAATCRKHVLVEKPIDISLEKADMLISEAIKNKVKLSVISQHRFDDDVVMVKTAVENGELGKLYFGGSYTKWYRPADYYAQSRWHGTKGMDGGGALINQSIHYIDLLQYIMGQVDEVFGYCINGAHPEIDVEDTGAAAVRFKSGAIGVIEGTTAAYPGFNAQLEVLGDEGSVVIENDEIVRWETKSGKSIINSDLQSLGTGNSSPEISYQSHKRQIEDFINSIIENRDPSVTGEDGRKALEIVIGIYRSANTGSPVKLPL